LKLTDTIMDKKFLLSLILATGVCSSTFLAKADNPNYHNNRYPLIQKPYIELPLGCIKAKGWLLEMLERQKEVRTG
jgi:hypothetical protein